MTTTMKTLRQLGFLMVVVVAVGGCNREEPTPQPVGPQPGLGSTKPPASPQMVEASKANVPPGASSQPMGSSIETGLDKGAVGMLVNFTAALGAGDADKAKAFFIAHDTYARMFKKEGLDTYYDSLKQQFDASIAKNIAGLAGATYVNYEMGADAQAGVYESGVTMGDATLVSRTTVAEDVRAVVRVGEREVEVQIPRMVLTADGWRALQPIVVRAHQMKQTKAPQPPTGDQNPTTLPEK